MGVTKCFQTNENIVKMAQAAFGEKGIPQIEELKEGMCNVAYKLTYADGFQTILKIASPVKTGFLTNEVNLMAAEVKAMQLVRECTAVKVAEVYAYDTGKTLCEGDYFFMECMEGVNWITVYDDLSEEIAAKLRKEIGKIQRQLTLVTNSYFGMLGDEERHFENLYDFIRYMIGNVINDAEARGVKIGVSQKEILSALEKDKEYFDMVSTPSLVHWDMWEGNVFIKDGAVTGIIDWERAMWGEPLMDEPFRYHKRNRHLLEGYGREELSEAEIRRIYWYDILLYLTMMTEVFYREYEDEGQYHWSKGLFLEVWERIC